MVLLAGFLFLSNLSADSTASELRQATFVVGWYDVGKAALDGQKGVITVEKGWQNMHEINRVEYDPEKVTLEHIEDILKKSGTYISTTPPQ